MSYGDAVILGQSDVSVPRYGFGAAPIGNLFSAVSDAQAEATLNAANAAGLTYMDTAPHYGVGLAEERLGRWMRGHDRSRFVVSTKVGRLLRDVSTVHDTEEQGFVDTPLRRRSWDFSADGVRRSVRESCERLRLPSVDIALVHDPDDHRDEAFGAAMPELVRMREEGVVRAIGAGMNQAEMLTDLVNAFPLDAVLCAGRYTLFEQGALDALFPSCLQRGTSVIIGGVYNSGLLVHPAAGATYNYVTAGSAVLERAQQLKAVCDEFDVPLKAAAVQFPLAHPAVACVLTSGSSPDHVADNIRMIEYPIPEALWSLLRERELIRPDAPTPSAPTSSVLPV